MPTTGLRSCATERRQAPPLHENIMSGFATGLASPLNDAAIQNGNIKSPSNKEAGLDVSHHALVSREGGKSVFS